MLCAKLRQKCVRSLWGGYQMMLHCTTASSKIIATNTHEVHAFFRTRADTNGEECAKKQQAPVTLKQQTAQPPGNTCGRAGTHANATRECLPVVPNPTRTLLPRGCPAHKISGEEPLNMQKSPFVVQICSVSQSVRPAGATPSRSRGKERQQLERNQMC